MAAGEAKASHLIQRLVIPVLAPACVALLLLLAPVGESPTTQPPQIEASAVGLETTIKQSVRRVLVDVVVTDAHGNSVTGLRREDFRVLENGTPQQIRSISVPWPTSPRSPEINLSTLPLGTFSNASSVPDDSPLNVILWDLQTYESGFRNTQAEGNVVPAMLFARRQLIEFLRHKPVGSRFAIILQTDRLSCSVVSPTMPSSWHRQWGETKHEPSGCGPLCIQRPRPSPHPAAMTGSWRRAA